VFGVLGKGVRIEFSMLLGLIAALSGALADTLDRSCNGNPAARIQLRLQSLSLKIYFNIIHAQWRLNFSLCLANKALIPHPPRATQVACLYSARQIWNDV
jgi:hypothetical protein